MRVNALAIVLSLALASCFDDECAGIACGPAGPPLTVIIQDVADATVVVTREDGMPVETDCFASGTDTRCESTSASPPGVYLVHVEATGYEPADLEVTVEATAPGGCCNPGYVEESVTVDLVPA